MPGITVAPVRMATFAKPGLALALTPKRVVINVKLRMQPGESILPDLLSTRPLRSESSEGELAKAYAYRGESVEPYDTPPEPGEPVDPRDVRSNPGRLFLAIEPGEASIYLDGHFLGTGTELTQLRSGLLIDAGEHLIQVIHPKYETREESFSVEAGGKVELDLRLEG